MCFRRRTDVIFGVTLRLLVINISLSSPAINKLHRLPAIVSSTRYGPSQLSVLHLPLQAFTACDGARDWLRIAIFAYSNPIRIRRPVRGVSVKLEWFSYPTVTKILKIRLLVLTEYDAIQYDTVYINVQLKADG